MTHLTAEARKTLRNLTHAYLMRPDPVNWMVAADLLEENGRDASASRWRKRAAWFHDIYREARACLDESPPSWNTTYIGPVRHVDVGPFRVKMRRRRLSLRVWVRWVKGIPGDTTPPDEHPWRWGRYWRLNVRDRTRFFNEKVLGLIDDLHDNPL